MKETDQLNTVISNTGYSLLNQNITTSTAFLPKETPIKNGIDCPHCGHELFDTYPSIILTSDPAQKNVHCENCDYVGYRRDNMITDWLDKYGNPNIEKKVETKLFMEEVIRIIKETPNDMELGKRIREWYYQTQTNKSGINPYRVGKIDNQ